MPKIEAIISLAILTMLATPTTSIGVGEIQAAAANSKNKASLEPLNEVDPFIGTSAHGHTYPGATVPFGMVQLSPDTRRDTWDGCSGYHWSDNSILGFSHTHLSGTGCGDLGDVSFLPTTAKIDPNSVFDYKNYHGTFSHTDEKAMPGYYSVKFAGMKAELTASKRVGFHRYTFPKTKDSTIIVDLTHGISDEPLELVLNIVDDQTVTGMRRSKGWAKNQFVYFAAKFSKPFTAFGTLQADKPQASVRKGHGKNLGCWLTFDTTNDPTVLAKVGLSSVSEDGALKNLQSEVPHWDFDKTSQEAKESWRSALSKIQISSPDEKKAKTFYTSLYHSLLAPTLVSDVDGSYRGSDSAVHKAVGFENYSTFSLWDTFRAEHPLLTIIEPGRVNDFINSFIVQAQYHEQKTLPIWPLASNETFCMIGYHSFPVIAEAYSKGFREWDAEAMFKLMVANTARNDWWAKTGYIAANKEPESVSKTLEFAYDDWCLAQFAKALGHKAEAEKFAQRGEAYKNVFDQQSGFMRGRLLDGTWRTPFDATAVIGDGPLKDFTEANSWQYTFFAPQDPASLIDLYGGRAKFVAKLDQMFIEPIKGKIDFNDVSGLIGQYAQGNEPSHHVAYLYSYAGAPAKTAQHVKQICDTLYNGTPEGLCGNEDCGQMSAWYIFSTLGFYPVNPVQGTYVIGTPMFPKSKINLPGGKEFTVLAPGLSEKRFYIQKASLNGKPLDRVFISHQDIMSGGTLELTMTDKAGSWGCGANAAP